MQGGDNSAFITKRARYKALLSCDYCKPHRSDNSGRRPKHGAKKPKYKDKR